jgi:hypothetical protein
MKKTNIIFSLILVILPLLGQRFPTEVEKRPIDDFLYKSGIWSGKFVNFVNQEDGMIQRGKIRMKVSVDSSGVIKQSIALIRPDGTASDYQGSATMKVEGNRLKWIGLITKDENTGNPIENHVFEGYIVWNQIYAVETYEELFPDGRREKRRNNIHYVVLGEEKVLWQADIHVDGKLFVFANTVLESQKTEKVPSTVHSGSRSQ